MGRTEPSTFTKRLSSPMMTSSRVRVVQGDGSSGFGVAVQFNVAGAQKMRQATAGHVGRPMAILVDGVVVVAPVVRSVIGASAVINGEYTEAEAEKIVNGIGIR